MYDPANLKKLAKFGELAPAIWEGFLAFDRAAMADGAIPAKTKELIAVAVAVTTQCPYCIDIHSKRAKAAGCTEAELAEAVLVSAASAPAGRSRTGRIAWRDGTTEPRLRRRSRPTVRARRRGDRDAGLNP